MDAFGAKPKRRKAMQPVPELYKKYFIDIGIERLEIFKLIKEKFNINRVLYPGSFVHISPSFFFPEVIYLDLDKRCKKFFSQKETIAYIESKKEYNQEPILKYYEMSFEEENEEEPCSFDLLVSQFAGFISIHCTKYLKKNGILLVNDSHGDATMAYCSGEYDLIAVTNNEPESV